MLDDICGRKTKVQSDYLMLSVMLCSGSSLCFTFVLLLDGIKTSLSIHTVHLCYALPGVY